VETFKEFERYIAHLSEGLGHADRHAGLKGYCTGLMLPLARKSVEPMAASLEPQRVSARHQALHHFVARSEWSDAAVLARVRDWVVPSLGLEGGCYWIVDDTGFPKKGRHSVGVARQYCGQLGKQDNCQVAVSLSLASTRGSVPVAYQLYLPQDWAADPVRRQAAGVPERLGDRSRLATASMDQTIRLWDVATGAAVQTLEGHSNLIDALATDRDGKRLISGSSDGTAKLWDTDTGGLMATLPSFGGPVYGVAMSADGRHVAAGSADGTALLADVATPVEAVRLRVHEGGPVYRVGFSLDGSRLFTEGAVNAVRIWSQAPASTVGVIPADGLEHKTVQSKLDRGEMFVDNEGSVQVIDAITRQVVRTLTGHKIKVSHVAISKDGRLVATASQDNTAMIWRRSGGAR
jgi:hypothetical protein